MRNGDASTPIGACLADGRRSEGDPDRAASCDRFPRIADAYVRETIAGRCRSGAAAVREHQPDRLLASPSNNGCLLKERRRLHRQDVINQQLQPALALVFVHVEAIHKLDGAFRWDEAVAIFDVVECNCIE